MPTAMMEPLRIPADFWQRANVLAALDTRDIGALFRILRQHTGASQGRIGIAVAMDQSEISKIMSNGPRQQRVTALEVFTRIADGLNMPNHARAALGLANSAPVANPDDSASAPAPTTDRQPSPDARPTSLDAESEAVELVRRIEASDVSSGTLARLQQIADRMAMAYAGTPPADLLPQVRQHLAYVTSLTDARMTLSQRRTLLITGGWLALLTATLHIDLRQGDTADAWLVTAEQMAGHADYDEITAWCHETRAWNLLTVGRYRDALDLSQRAQAIAPTDSSALIQATAQEGRAWARMKRPTETRDALTRVAQLVNNLPTPENPEHHYRYDPAKAISYTATTLAWVGDPAAEEFARTAIDELTNRASGVPRPRRIASARLDLSLALIAANKPDEASAEALTAVASGRIVPSNWWRATEVLHGVEQAGIPEANDLREAYRAYRPALPATPA